VATARIAASNTVAKRRAWRRIVLENMMLPPPSTLAESFIFPVAYHKLPEPAPGPIEKPVVERCNTPG